MKQEPVVYRNVWKLEAEIAQSIGLAGEHPIVGRIEKEPKLYLQIGNLGVRHGWISA